MPATLTRHDQQLIADIAALDRLAAMRPQAKPSLCCRTCQRFIADPINPTAGMGNCRDGHGMWHAGAPHHCNHHLSL